MIFTDLLLTFKQLCLTHYHRLYTSALSCPQHKIFWSIICLLLIFLVYFFIYIYKWSANKDDIAPYKWISITIIFAVCLSFTSLMLFYGFEKNTDTYYKRQISNMRYDERILKAKKHISTDLSKKKKYKYTLKYDKCKKCRYFKFSGQLYIDKKIASKQNKLRKVHGPKHWYEYGLDNKDVPCHFSNE